MIIMSNLTHYIYAWYSKILEMLQSWILWTVLFWWLWIYDRWYMTDFTKIHRILMIVILIATSLRENFADQDIFRTIFSVEITKRTSGLYEQKSNDFKILFSNCHGSWNAPSSVASLFTVVMVITTWHADHHNCYICNNTSILLVNWDRIFYESVILYWPNFLRISSNLIHGFCWYKIMNIIMMYIN